jgi:hypothetical protein
MYIVRFQWCELLAVFQGLGAVGFAIAITENLERELV